MVIGKTLLIAGISLGLAAAYLAGSAYAPATAEPALESSGKLAPFLTSNPRSVASRPDSQPVDSCATCHRKNGDEIIGFYERSTHFRRSVSCSHCHGGTPSAQARTEAHHGSFVGRPDPKQTLAMCGSCHTNQLAVFKTGRHYISSKGVPRLDCVQCHGAHTVGAQASTFSISYLCAGCHGLEYLPSLPAELRNVLDQSDKIRESLRSIEQSGKKPSDEAIALRREVKRLTADVVHPTDIDGGAAKIAEIRRLSESLLAMLERDKR